MMARTRKPSTPKADAPVVEEVVETPEETKAIRPNDLAKELKLKDGKRIRAFLRQEFARSPDAKNSSWELTQAQVDAVREKFGKKEDDESTEDAA